MIKHNPCNYANCNEPRWGGGYCKRHQEERTDQPYLRAKAKRENKTKQKTPISKYPKKNDGEGVFLQMIIDIYCKINDDGEYWIDYVTGKPFANTTPYNAHHVLCKGNYPAYKLYNKNIIILNNENHNKVHTKAKSDLCNPEKEPDSQGWIRYFELYDFLKNKYEETIVKQ